MPLFDCRECGHKVADSAPNCPSCGVEAPTADAKVVARRKKHLPAWVLPAVLLLATFGWHVVCLPFTGMGEGRVVVKSVNPITNVVVIGAPPGNEYTRLGYRLAVPMLEADMKRRARENLDVWGMVIGYSVRIDS